MVYERPGNGLGQVHSLVIRSGRGSKTLQSLKPTLVTHSTRNLGLLHSLRCFRGGSARDTSWLLGSDLASFELEGSCLLAVPVY